MKKIICSFIIILFLLVSLCLAKLENTTLENMIYASEYILIGKTTQIFLIEDHIVTEIEVMQTLKGLHVKKLYYLGKTSFACDNTKSIVGTEALFFLVDKSTPFFNESASFRSKLEQITSDAPVLRIARYGEGRMPFRKVKSKSYVTLWTSSIKLPEHIITIPFKKEKYADLIRSASLDQMLDFIKLKVGEQEPKNFIQNK